MARPRSEPEPEITVTEVDEEGNEIKRSEGWKRAYAHAIEKGNTEKAAMFYADSWEHDFEDDAA